MAKIARIPPKNVSKDDAEVLQDLEGSLKRVVFGQDPAIEALSSAIKLARAGLREPEKPIGNYLFAGPTGVGKTEVAKQLADTLGVEMLRFDMSEYMEKHAVSRLIGAPPGYVGFDQGGLLTDGVDQHPHCVLLLDEIEKAHPDVFNILLQVMDHGTLTDHNGRTVDFRNVILIMTSNAGATEQAKSADRLRPRPPRGRGYRRHRADVHARVPQPSRRGDLASRRCRRRSIMQVVEKFVLQLEAQLMDRGVTIELTQARRGMAGREGLRRQDGRPPAWPRDPGAHQEAARRGAALRQAGQGRRRAGLGRGRQAQARPRRSREAAAVLEAPAAPDRGVMLRASALLLLASAAPVAAEAFLSLPLDCTLGQDCYIEDYHDAQPGPGQQDYTCGLKSRDGHRGTDFALLSFAQMEAGVNVLAAAPGTVEAVRDGEPDIALTEDRREAIAGRECGNAVRIGHENGMQTLYCHMKNGSVAVAPGDSVAAGDVLGEVGLSGETNYPHVHLSVLDGDARIDPFAPESTEACGAGGETLWTDPPAYDRSGLFTAGFSIVVPSFDAVKSGTARRAVAAPDEALVLYGHAFYPETGDVLEFSAQGPDGEIFSHEEEIAEAQAQLFRAFGRRAPDEGWPAGDYTGTVLQRRGETVIAVRHAAITVR